MRRRTYLAMTSSAAVCFAGCTASSPTHSDGSGGDGSESTTADERPSPPADEETSPTDEPSREHPDAGTVDDFEDLEAWEVRGGTLEADPNRAVVGSQSARLEVPASRETTRLAKTFAEPRDVTDVVPGVAVASDEFVVPWVRLVDTDGNVIDYRRGVRGELPLLRYNFGVESIDAGFDAASVREVRVRVWTDEGNERTVWFDDLHVTPRPETGQVMIQFDDGSATDYTEALPILEEYDYPAATFVNPADIDGSDRGLTTDQLHELDDADWCIGNHTRSHARLTDLGADEQETEIREGKEWLVERGFEGADYFAYPFGEYDATTLELVADYHAIGFAAGRPVQGYTTNARLASRIGEPSADRVRTVLERTAELRGITSILYHDLEGDDLEAFETLVETLHDYESTGKLEVILPSDLEERFLF